MTAGQGHDRRAQRRRVLRTAWLLAAVAVAIFTAFVLSGVLRA